MSSTWLEKHGMPWCFRADSGKMAKGGQAFVINLDDKGERGTHWTAAGSKGRKIFYADPFGTILGGYPPKELRLPGYRLVSNSISWQRPSTDYCGYYAYLFAKAIDGLNEDSSQKDLEHALWTSIR